MTGYPQKGAMRCGHISGAVNVPWAHAVTKEGTFKRPDEPRGIYEGDAGLSEGEDVVAYFRIGKRCFRT